MWHTLIPAGQTAAGRGARGLLPSPGRLSPTKPWQTYEFSSAFLFSLLLHQLKMEVMRLHVQIGIPPHWLTPREAGSMLRCPGANTTFAG